MSKHRDHHVTIRLTYVNGERRTPHKWRADCTCGHTFLSWQWIAADRPGGALPMALAHLGLIPDVPAYGNGLRDTDELP